MHCRRRSWGICIKVKRNDQFPMLMISRKFSMCAEWTQSFLRSLQKDLNINIIPVNMYIYRSQSK